MALHHLTLAHQVPLAYAHRPSHQDIIGGIQVLKKTEFKNPLPPDVFQKVFSHCNATSLAFASGACKCWRISINGSPDLFRRFEMEGHADQLSAGLELFGRRSLNTIQEVEIRVKSHVDTGLQRERLEQAITGSVSDLETLSIGHHGEFCWLILSIAVRHPTLGVLCSFDYPSNDLSQTREPGRERRAATFSSLWNPSLEVFIWNGAQNFHLDDAWLQRLQESKKIVTSSSKLSPSWVVQLLARNSHLEQANFRWLS